MTTINNSINDLYAISSVQDLSCNSAATVQGGAVEFYTDADFRGAVGHSAEGVLFGNLPLMANGWFHDSISSIKNNTNRTLVVCTDVNLGGSRKYLRSGQHMSWVGHQLNDKISSFALLDS